MYFSGMAASTRLVNCLKTEWRMIALIFAIGIGAGLGFLLRSFDIHKDPRNVMYVAFTGDIFLNMLKIVILPLIVSSLITGLAQMESQTSGKIGLRAVIYYMSTTILAVILGIALVSAIQPGNVGKGVKTEDLGVPDAVEPATTADTFLDLIRNMFPPNIVQACTAQYRTVLKPPKEEGTGEFDLITAINSSMVNGTLNMEHFLAQLVEVFPMNDTGPPNKTVPTNEELATWVIGGKFVDGMNILGIVVFSIVFGIVISKAGEDAKPLANFFVALNVVMMKVVGIIMWFAPVGICFVIAGQIMKIDDFSEMISQLGMYFLTVVTGLCIHGLIVLPLIFFVFTRKNPFSYLAGAGRAIATAFATSSSTATLPITMECLERNNGVDPRISRFVLPIGATINMDGTALYEAVAAIFVAQTLGIPLPFGKIVSVSITATAAAIGAAGVPQAGLVTLVMVLDAVGVSAEYVGTILAVDWLLDRIRTAVNVLGDVIGTGIVDISCKSFLAELDAAEANREVLPVGDPSYTQVEVVQMYPQNHVKINNPNGKVAYTTIETHSNSKL